jgi:hypothetical protein
VPEKMNHTGYGQSCTKFYVPSEYFFDKSYIPFVGHLESNKQAGDSCQNKGNGESQIPEFPVDLEGEITNTIKKVTD